jgi:hypothetical protein
MIKQAFSRIGFIALDFLASPGLLMGKKGNAKYHVHLVCKLCPASRKKFRDIEGNGLCWWNENWKKGNYDIPRNMGAKNLLKTYFGRKIDSDKFSRK